MYTIQNCNPTVEMDRLVNRILGGAVPAGDEWKGWAPACDFIESENEIRLFLDLPGLKKEDLDIQLKNATTLLIQGNRKAPEFDREKTRTRRMERVSGQFARAIALPYEVDPATISATFRDGVLDIVLHKPEALKPRRIEINA